MGAARATPLSTMRLSTVSFAFAGELLVYSGSLDDIGDLVSGAALMTAPGPPFGVPFSESAGGANHAARNPAPYRSPRAFDIALRYDLHDRRVIAHRVGCAILTQCGRQCLIRVPEGNVGPAQGVGPGQHERVEDPVMRLIESHNVLGAEHVEVGRTNSPQFVSKRQQSFGRYRQPGRPQVGAKRTHVARDLAKIGDRFHHDGAFLAGRTEHRVLFVQHHRPVRARAFPHQHPLTQDPTLELSLALVGDALGGPEHPFGRVVFGNPGHVVRHGIREFAGCEWSSTLVVFVERRRERGHRETRWCRLPSHPGE